MLQAVLSRSAAAAAAAAVGLLVVMAVALVEVPVREGWDPRPCPVV